MRTSLRKPRIHNRSPWPPRLHPSAHRGIRQGLSFSPGPALCGAEAWVLSPMWRSECGAQQADPDHHGRDLSQSVVFAYLPLALFSALERKRFDYWERNMNGSFVGWS